MMKSLLFLFSIILSFSSFAKGPECPAELAFKDYYFVFEGKVAGHMHITTSPEVLEVMKDFFYL